MSKPTYYEMLQDPRWQKKRLEVLQAADFKCGDCGAGDRTLHVHHMYYERGKKPWEYPDVALRSLCEDCHFRIQDLQAEIAREIGGLHTQDLAMVHGFVVAMRALVAHGRGNKAASIPVATEIGEEPAMFDCGAYRMFGIHPDNYWPLAKGGASVAVQDIIDFKKGRGIEPDKVRE